MDVPHIIAGRFRIECEIGTGGMGTVYRATHLGLERPVAVKIIKPEFASDPDVADRFMREARTMAKLRHPHAAMIFDAGNLPDGRHFIIMEFVEGATLSQTLAREGRFTAERAVRIACDICDVLAEAHKLGIIHRDLKPSNIMLNERGVCVLDFGVAKVLATSTDVTATHGSTGSGVIVGTPRYMSPEQCLGQRVGVRSDLYSLGVLIYEMLTGQPPFTDPLQSALIIKQAVAPPPPLTRLRADVPRPLAQAVHALLAKRPEERPRDAEAARALLERSLARPVQAASEAQPFASTIASVNSGSYAVFRMVTPLALIATLGLALFVLGHGGKTAPQTSSSKDEPVVAAGGAASQIKESPTTLRRPTALDAARQVVSSISHGSAGDVRIVQTGRGAAILALQDQRRAGTSHLLLMERRGARYLVTARAPLDTPGFRGARWTAESVDLDGDGREEVLYTGTNARGSASSYRLVLYVPRKRESYILSAEDAGRGKKPARLRWSPNALTRKAATYRTALLRRAIGGMKDEG